MTKCVNENCDYFKEHGECSSVCENNGFTRIFTNYDRIRNMSIEELARFMNECGHDFPPYCEYIKAASGRCDHNCFKCAKHWLEAEVTE